MDLSLYPPHAGLDEGRLMIGGCRVADLAQEFGTPAYLIDAAGLRERAQAFHDALTSRHPRGRVLFASKSFPTPSVMGLVAQGGCGLDVAGLGELLAAERTGVDRDHIVLHGNAKSDAEIAKAIDMRIGFIVVDNLDDVLRISRLAQEPVPVLLRVSPAVDAETNEKMATGHDASKFGIPSHQITDAIGRIRSEPMLDLRGLHAHVGSQILNVERLVSAVHRHLGTDVELLIEPGRSMVGPNGTVVDERDSQRRIIR